MSVRIARHLLGAGLLLAATALTPAAAQEVTLGDAGYFEARGVNVLVFSNWYDGLFADSKISGVEIVQQGVRTATNGDVRLSATPGQWDPIGSLVSRNVDKAAGTIEAVLEYKDLGFRYRVRAERKGDAVVLAVILDQPLPATLAGKAGFNLEFQPGSYFHKGLLADGRPGQLPLHPSGDMVAGGDRLPSSGRDVGPGAEPLPFATGSTLVLAPEDPARRVTIASSTGEIGIYDGRNQANNGYYVVRGLLPQGKTGHVLEWTLKVNSVADWVRPPVIAHSQLGYIPEQSKQAVIELDANDKLQGPVKLLRVNPDGSTSEAAAGAARPWGKYLRYNYATFDFSQVRDPGLYQLDYAGRRTAAFRIAPDLYADAWHPSLDVFLPVQMDHMTVNEAYRVWHADSHRDDARQAPVNHEHIDLYRQGPTTDTRYKPGEHIPGLAVGGWLDAGDFDQRTQTQYAVIRQLVAIWEEHKPERDQSWIDQKLRRVELHLPDGKPDILQQVEHGVLQLLAQYDAIGFAIHGIVEPDVAQYTHLGDAGSKTDGKIYDSSLAFGEVKGDRSGTPDDRWVFTSRTSALNYGSAAALAAAGRVLGAENPELAAKSLARAKAVWDEEASHPPYVFTHGNTTGRPLDAEHFSAAVELLLATGEAKYANAVSELWPKVSERFPFLIDEAMRAIPKMPDGYRDSVKAAVVAQRAKPFPARPNPFGVPITEGGWAGNGLVMNVGINDYYVHKYFPDLSDGSAVFRALDYLHGTHPGSDVSFVSGVGAVSKEVAYGSNRADFSYIAGGVVPGVLVIKPDLPENSDQWPFFWGQNEYVVNMGPLYIALVQAGLDLLAEQRTAKQ